MRLRYLRRYFFRRHYASCVVFLTMLAFLMLSYTNCSQIRIAPIQTDSKYFQK